MVLSDFVNPVIYVSIRQFMIFSRMLRGNDVLGFLLLLVVVKKC